MAQNKDKQEQELKTFIVMLVLFIFKTRNFLKYGFDEINNFYILNNFPLLISILKKISI